MDNVLLCQAGIRNTLESFVPYVYYLGVLEFTV